MGVETIKHNLVPKHEKLSKEEKENILKELNIYVKQLPKIRRKDAALQGLDVEIGDVIRILRRSSTTKEALYYRMVVDG